MVEDLRDTFEWSEFLWKTAPIYVGLFIGFLWAHLTRRKK